MAGTSVSGQVQRRTVLGAVLGVGLGAAAIAVVPAPAEATTAAQVTEAKQRLTDQGYWCGAVNGTVDALTTCAVLAYQKANRLTADGILDYDIRRALATVHTPAHFTSTGKVLEIDMARQLVRFVEEGQAVLTLHATTGSNASSTFGQRAVWDRTPRGKFHVRAAGVGWVDDPMGQVYRPHYFLSDLSVHGRSDLASLRGPTTTGGIAVHEKALDLMVSRGYLARRRLVYVA